MAKRGDYTLVDVNGISCEMRPARLGKGPTGKLVGYALVPVMESDTSVNAKASLEVLIDEGWLSWSSIAKMVQSALAIDLQALVRSRSESQNANPNKLSDAEYNVAFSQFFAPLSDADKIAWASKPYDELRNAVTAHGLAHRASADVKGALLYNSPIGSHSAGSLGLAVANKTETPKA